MHYNIDILIQAQLEQGLTTLKLAKLCRMPESTVRGILKDKAGHPDNIKVIANVLGFELKELIQKNGKH